ncbi:hypothetical protein ACN47E_000978 [Coniothyrium glycines]
MVQIAQVRQCINDIDDTTAPRVGVFMGGTSGIGKITLARLVELGYSFKAYVVGRKSSENSFREFAQELRVKYPKAELVWVEGEVSLLSEVRRVCNHIKALERFVDILFMTTGYAPFNARKYTSEGLDLCHALTVYSRMCFAENLLPLLRASGRARVISVQAAGMESTKFFLVDDLMLDTVSAAGRILRTQLHLGVMQTLYLERLAEAKENSGVVFMHSHPGIVRTGNLYRGFDAGSWGSWLASITIDPVLMIVGYSFEESADKFAYQVVSGVFGRGVPRPDGSTGLTTRGRATGGLFLVDRNCDTVANEIELKKLRAVASQSVWEKVIEVISPYT